MTRSRNDLNRTLLIVAIILFSISLIGFLVSLIPLETHSVYASTTIEQGRAGFDLNESALTFGIVDVGGTATRGVAIENTHSFPIRVSVSARGTIETLLTYEDTVRIAPGESAEIVFSIIGVAGSEGFYDGTVRFRTYRSF